MSMPIVFSVPQASLHSNGVLRIPVSGLIAGQDSSTINRRKGLTYEYFYVGEAVSVSRSDGRRTVAEVTSVTPAGMVVNMGVGVSKTILAPDIPMNVSKLLGAFYIIG